MKSFTQFYEKYCKEKKVKSKVHILKNQHMKINVDRLDKDDWTPVIQGLKNYSNDLHTIDMYSVYAKNSQQPHMGRLVKTTSEPAFVKEPLLKSLFEALAISIVKSDELSSVSLQALPVNGYIELLCNSFINQTHLQYLSLKCCKLSDSDVIHLCRALSTHTGLQTVNLTDCGIKTEGAQQIAALIRSQKLVRYGETWKQCLRYRTPQPEIVPGLRRLTLNDNPDIGDDGFRIIAYEIIEDLWVKAMDFQNCGITNASKDIAVELTEKNKMLKILDLRRNKLGDEIVKQIISVLVNNNNFDDGYEWINSTKSDSVDSLQPKGSVKTYAVSAAKASRNNLVHTNIPMYIKNNNFTNGPENLKKPLSRKVSIDKPHNILGELIKTKRILHKVSGKLYEETNKRETLEKQHKEFKQQIQGIRSYLQDYKSNSQTGSSVISNTTVKQEEKSICNSSKNIKKSTNTKTFAKKKNSDTHIIKKKTKKIPTENNSDKETYSNNFSCISKPTTATQLYLLVPKSYQKTLSKFAKLTDQSI